MSISLLLLCAMAKVVVDAEFGWLGETNPEQDIITPMKHNKLVKNGL